jgi:type IV pilus assembly protein PilM
MFPYEANSYYTDAAKFGKPDAKRSAAHAPGGSAQGNWWIPCWKSATVWGLIPLSVDIEVLSCYRVLKEQLTDFVLLDIGRGYSLITIFQGGAPVAQRSIPHGSQMFDSAIADSVGCSLEEAEQTKKETNILGAEDEAVHEKYKALFDAVDNMDKEVHRTCEYYRINKKEAVFT